MIIYFSTLHKRYLENLDVPRNLRFFSIEVHGLIALDLLQYANKIHIVGYQYKGHTVLMNCTILDVEKEK